jgi:hypothetical protein
MSVGFTEVIAGQDNDDQWKKSAWVEKSAHAQLEISSLF